MKTSSEIWFDKDEKGVLFFHLRKASTACKNAIPFEFDGPATAEHIKQYESQFQEFLGKEASKEVAESEMKEASTGMLDKLKSLMN